MGDWNISRKRYFGLPLPFYPCACGAPERDRLARGARGARDRAGSSSCRSSTGRGSTRCAIRCEACGRRGRRIPEVGDAWLDAGIVPLLDARLAERRSRSQRGYATGAAAGLTGADLPDHAYWEKWFPADWVSEMREQIRLWFYSQCFMAVTLVGRSPVPARAHVREAARRDGPGDAQVVGERDRGDEALDRMGADVDALALLRAAAEPEHALRLRAGRRGEAAAAHALELGLVLRHVREHRRRSTAGARERAGRARSRSTAGSSRAPQQLVARGDRRRTSATGRRASTRAFERFVDDLSNWYIRRSRRRFWDGDEAALRTLWYALVQALRVIAPVMPFLAEHLWRHARRRVSEDGPSRCFLRRLAGGGRGRRTLLAEVADVRRVVELGRQARGAGGLKLRQPLATRSSSRRADARARTRTRSPTSCASRRSSSARSSAELRVKPNLPRARPEARRSGSPRVRRRSSGRVRGARRRQVPRRRRRARAARRCSSSAGRPRGLGGREDAGVTVALDTALDDELRLRGPRARPHPQVNAMRKDARPRADRPHRSSSRPATPTCSSHGDWISRGDARRRDLGRRGTRPREDLGLRAPQEVDEHLAVALRFLEEGDVRAVLEERMLGALNAARQRLRNRRRAGVVPPGVRGSEGGSRRGGRGRPSRPAPRRLSTRSAPHRPVDRDVALSGAVPAMLDEAFAQFRPSRNSAYQWEPSQNGLFLDWPQRHSA